MKRSKPVSRPSSTVPFRPSLRWECQCGTSMLNRFIEVGKARLVGLGFCNMCGLSTERDPWLDFVDAATEAMLLEQSAGEEGYRQAIEAAARGLWLDVFSYDEFVGAMISTVRRGFTRAWRDGAAEGGILPDEMTAVEQFALQSFIQEDVNAINGLAGFIEEHSKARKGKWGTVVARLNPWANKYRLVQSQAAAFAAKNRKMMFELGAAKKHCPSCLGLDGRVYRYEVWSKNGAIPPSKRFECNGFNCLCDLKPTEARMTPGPFPKGLLK